MSDTEEEIVVEAIPDALEVAEPIAAEPGTEAAAPVPPAEVSAEEGVEQLRSRLERAESETRAEQAARLQAERTAQQAQGAVRETNVARLTDTVDRLKEQQENLKQQWALAAQENNYTEMADIQARMSDNAAARMQILATKSQMEQPQQTARQAPADPVEQLAAQLTPRSAAWVRAHPEFATDQRLYNKMLAAHNLVMADGASVDSDDYFNGVERILGIQSDAARPRTQPEPQRRQAPPPAAPAGGSNGNGSNPNIVRLTAQERDMARLMQMTDLEYAKNKRALQKEGKLH